MEQTQEKGKVMHHREGRLQAECVLWYRNEWYSHPRSLWATFNEGQNVNNKNSLGLIPGVSDLLYNENWNRGLIGLEMKYPGERHDTARLISQATWIIEICNCGGFVDDFDMFRRVIKGENCWIDPVRVLEYCRKIKHKTIEWDKRLFLGENSDVGLRDR